MTQTQELPRSTPALDPIVAKRNRRTAIAMMVVFIAPVLVAYILLKTGIYQNFGTSNKGLLLDPPQSILDLSWREFNLSEPEKLLNETQIESGWWLAYEMPAQCETSCQQRLLQIRQSLQTLGPEQKRVHPLIITSTESDLDTLALWQEQLEALSIQTLQIQMQSKHPLPSGEQERRLHTQDQLKPGGLYIIDPMGFVMLYYAPALQAEDAIPQAKSLIKDLKYLLKVSRIG